MTGITAHPPVRRLPINVRPHLGETVDSYIQRLARANHLRPSYLHRYLVRASGYHGRPQPERLAAASGRTVSTLQRALPGLIPPPHRAPGTRAAHPKIGPEKKARLFAQIRTGFDEGLSIRALMRKHNVGFRAVRQALDSGSPPPRKTFIREPPQLGPLHHVIDALLQEELAARPDQRPRVQRIWEQLLDEHGATISYGTVRDYLAGRRPAAMR